MGACHVSEQKERKIFGSATTAEKVVHNYTVTGACLGHRKIKNGAEFLQGGWAGGSCGGWGVRAPTQKFREPALSQGLPGMTLVPGGLPADMWSQSHAYWLEQHPRELWRGWGGGEAHSCWVVHLGCGLSMNLPHREVMREGRVYWSSPPGLSDVHQGCRESRKVGWGAPVIRV